MFNGIITSSKQLRKRGQALVETALFLPIFLVILAGVVEVSQYVVTTNRVTSATRASTRFASNGGEDAGMASVLQNAITNTLSVDQVDWDVYAIRGTLNDGGTGFSDWEFTPIFGISATLTNTNMITRPMDVDQTSIQTQILNDLNFDEDGNRIPPDRLEEELGELRIVGTYAVHYLDSILNLDATPALADIYSVSQLSVMRISGLNVEASEGCSAFPIALGQGGIRSLTGPGTGSDPYPEASEFDYPVTPPIYQQFVRHQPSISLDDNTTEGTIFKFTKGTANNNYSWLSWNQLITPGEAVLANSLQWPGDSADFSNHGDTGTNHPEYGYVVRGYSEPGNVINTELHVEDRVPISPVQLGSDITFGIANQPLNENISRGRDLRLMVFNNIEGGTNSVIVDRFGIFKVRGYGNAGAADEWLLIEFIRWDDTCGQLVEELP